jgi:NAD-reducing hydrogenase large subunit
MAERIEINPVTRIEGHAKISIFVDDAGKVQTAQFHIVEFRGFEKFCEGRPFYEMPGLMSRICGICPVSHILSSAKAGDAILGVNVPPAAEKQRRLMNYAQVLQSHALSFFHLSSPDFLLGMDSDPKNRNIFGVAALDEDFARRGIRIRQFGQRVIEVLGGKRIHPSWGVPGGVLKQLAVAERDELLAWIPEASKTMEIAIGRFKSMLDDFQEEIRHVGNFPSLYMGTVNEDGYMDFYDGRLRLADAEGNIVADGLKPWRYETFIAEASEEWSYMKFPYYKAMGYPTGMYRVGPLARCNVVHATGTALADKELREFRERRWVVRNESFLFHLARLIEMVHSVERMEELLTDPDILDEHIRGRADVNNNVGIGCTEAPRGTLFHHYEVDDNGLILKANLLIATAQNNLAMNKTIEQTAQHFVNPNKLSEGMLNRVEAAIRCYDPCLSCSTHAIGQMPLDIELIGPDGSQLDRIVRD